MTVVYKVGGHSLWLGGQPAANNPTYLLQNRIMDRWCLKETNVCRKDHRFHDLNPFRIDDVIGWEGDRDWEFVRQPIEVLDQVLAGWGEVRGYPPTASGQGSNVLVFCKQGARRSATRPGPHTAVIEDAQARPGACRG